MYLVVLAVGLGITYILFTYLFAKLFNFPTPRFSTRSLYSILGIIALSILISIASYIVPNEIVGNRILHTFGGGLLSLFVCFLVVKDNKFPLTKFQFLVLSFLIVTSLGVANEIIEFLLQHFAGFLAASTVNDTWLDLVSNTTGAIIGCIAFTPFVNNKS